MQQNNFDCIFETVTMKKAILLIALTVGVTGITQAQCDFDVTVGPQGILLCPGGTGELTATGADFDEIQWYSWLGYDWAIVNTLDGATSDTFALQQFDHSGFYFWVSATVDGCTENSDTVLVDGYVFNGVTVQNGGEGTFDANTGITNLACGDTATLEMMPPYTTNIVWFKDDEPIPGENSFILEITESGSYTVTGSPENCPDYTGFFGFSLIYEAVIVPPSLITASNDTLFASPAASYQWYFEGVALPTATDSFLVVSGNGSYVLKTVTEDSCISVSEPFVFTSSSTGFVSASDFTVMPVPAMDFIRWVAPATGPAEVRITDSSGRLIRVMNHNSGIVDVSILENGVYFLTILTNGESKTARFIKTN